ncbi:MAG: GGDEF domain-containing protein [Deltaproteobacteria bacterium]|jgi:diguanylate cyclase|nr:GGDEF domain-containing protein [Deltaproteobacteria bacterium]
MPQIQIEDFEIKTLDNSLDKNLNARSNFDSLVEATYEMAKKILPFLARRKIPLTPENYRLFYDYFLLLKPDLSKKIDQLLDMGCRFTPEDSDELFREFYQQADEYRAANLEKVGESMTRASETLNQNLGQSLESATHYRAVLADTASRISLTQMEDPSLKYLVDNLLEETLATLSSQNDLADHLEKTRLLVSSLTSELKDQARLANIDELTQLFNRRFFVNRLTKILATAGEDQILSLAIFDLDRFKRINDTWGHNIGDKVLILCAKIIKNAVGDNFMAVRYGGEEFIVLCPGLDKSTAKALAENIRHQMEITQVTIRGQNIPVTISGGVAQYAPGDTTETLIGRADQALYQAKELGRNQVRDL